MVSNGDKKCKVFSGNLKCICCANFDDVCVRKVVKIASLPYSGFGHRFYYYCFLVRRELVCVVYLTFINSNINDNILIVSARNIKVCVRKICCGN